MENLKPRESIVTLRPVLLALSMPIFTIFVQMPVSVQVYIMLS